MLTGNDHNHGEEVHSEEVIEPGVPEPVMLENTVEREHAHEHSGLEGLWEVMFGFEHVVAEFFWNGIFLLIGFVASRAISWRKIHKYIDDRHGVSHNREEY
jgi:hypothetical protein